MEDRTGVMHIVEEDSYWTFSESNLLARNAFAGWGYTKHVFRAKLTTTSFLPKDANG